MENCLVTKLKATVNNPNLPILETMQQFTLDAITASGNSSMTDAQKWALNHFFYRIGAIDNNGIWAKMEYLLMPMINGQNLSTAGYDYVSSSKKTINSNIEFSGNGLIHKGSGVSNITSTNSRSKASNNIFMACGLYPSSSTFANVTLQWGTSGNYRSHVIEATSSQGRWKWDNRVSIRDTSFAGVIGVVVSRDSNGYHGRYFSKSSITNGNITLVDLPNPPAELTGTYDIVAMAQQEPVGLWAYGEALSDTECATLADAIRELIVAFPNPVNNG